MTNSAASRLSAPTSAIDSVRPKIETSRIVIWLWKAKKIRPGSSGAMIRRISRRRSGSALCGSSIRSLSRAAIEDAVGQHGNGVDERCGDARQHAGQVQQTLCGEAGDAVEICGE